jgi:hypothetical protein
MVVVALLLQKAAEELPLQMAEVGLPLQKVVEVELLLQMAEVGLPLQMVVEVELPLPQKEEEALLLRKKVEALLLLMVAEFLRKEVLVYACAVVSVALVVGQEAHRNVKEASNTVKVASSIPAERLRDP